MIRTVLEPNLTLIEAKDIIIDLRDVLADVARAINHDAEVYALPLTGLDGPGESGGSVLTLGSVPFSDGTTLIEDNANFFYTDADDRLDITNIELAGRMDFDTISTPANPTVNQLRVFLRINGGDIELIGRGPTGAECVICTVSNAAIVEELQLNWVE